MYAIELNGAHVRRWVKITWYVNKKVRTKTVRITKLVHWPGGNVTLSLGYQAERYPFNAEVELLVRD